VFFPSLERRTLSSFRPSPLALFPRRSFSFSPPEFPFFMTVISAHFVRGVMFFLPFTCSDFPRGRGLIGPDDFDFLSCHFCKILSFPWRGRQPFRTIFSIGQCGPFAVLDPSFDFHFFPELYPNCFMVELPPALSFASFIRNPPRIKSKVTRQPAFFSGFGSQCFFPLGPREEFQRVFFTFRKLLLLELSSLPAIRFNCRQGGVSLST